MKAAIVLCFALAACVLARPEDKYTDRFDNIDIDEVTGNRNLMKAYIECCMGRGKCSPEGKELKSRISEALETECAKCTDAQKQGTEKVIRHLILNMPESWNELKGKFDPTGKYSKKYEDNVKKITA